MLSLLYTVSFPIASCISRAISLPPPNMRRFGPCASSPSPENLGRVMLITSGLWFKNLRVFLFVVIRSCGFLLPTLYLGGGRWSQYEGEAQVSDRVLRRDSINIFMRLGLPLMHWALGGGPLATLVSPTPAASFLSAASCPSFVCPSFYAQPSSRHSFMFGGCSLSF